MNHAALLAQLERQAVDAERMQATAPVAVVLKAVIADLRALDGVEDGDDGVDDDPRPVGESLLTAKQVAARLGLKSVKSVYRRAGGWPFTRRADGLLRFSASGFEKWLARR